MVKAPLRNELFVLMVISVAFALLLVVDTSFTNAPFQPPLLLRLVAGLAFVLFAPGYALQAALFPDDSDLDGPERMALSFGLSVAVVPLIALVIEYSPWELRLWPIYIAELVVIVTASTVAAIRRANQPQMAQVASQRSVGLRQWWATQDRTNRILYIILVAMLGVAATVAIAIFLLPSPGNYFTEYYLLGPDKLAEAYPRAAAPGEELWVTMGITNRERETMTYRVEVWAIDPWEERRELVQAAGPFALAVDETVEQRLTWAMPWAGQDQLVEFYLYTGDGGEPYRQLRLWLNVTKREG